ncbi:MAG: Methylthioribose-phosphate isomerase, partial [Hyphomicrobiales bacterium]|nr:Methylthioribose-phosphate isomerase [Hyphomicrobiales bacterium]
KALAAHDNSVPFYVAAPSSSIDFTIENAHRDIPIEQRSAQEVTHMSGETDAGEIATIRIVQEKSPVMNFAFDITPGRLVTGLITERGVIAATEDALAHAFPERL